MGTASAPIVTLATYDPNDIKPGWIAFWIVMGLCAVTVLLWLNMNKQLRKIQAPTREEVRAARRAEAAEATEATGAGKAAEAAEVAEQPDESGGRTSDTG